MPFQLGPSKLCLVAAKKLIEFDNEYSVIKWEALNSSQAACGLWTNFGENSTLPQHKTCNVHAGVESFILCYDLGLFLYYDCYFPVLDMCIKDACGKLSHSIRYVMKFSSKFAQLFAKLSFLVLESRWMSANKKL